MYVGICRDETWATYERNDNPPEILKTNKTRQRPLLCFFFFVPIKRKILSLQRELDAF